MKRVISDAFDAFWFLYDHPKSIDEDAAHPPTQNDRTISRGQFIHAMMIHYAKVNPKNRKVDDDESKNTRVEVWLETGPMMWDEHGKDWDTGAYISNVHDYHLDVGGNTFDEALIKLARAVQKRYGDY